MAVNPGLVILASIFFATPLVLAILADRQIRAFQHEAFGHLEKAARNLRIMVWFIFVYFLAILVGSYVIGDMKAMWAWPLASEGLQIYARIGAAIGGYFFALRVSKELYFVTKPRNG